jgi:hypothetical protein
MPSLNTSLGGYSLQYRETSGSHHIPSLAARPIGHYIPDSLRHDRDSVSCANALRNENGASTPEMTVRACLGWQEANSS